jgi:hypothetical protein
MKKIIAAAVLALLTLSTGTYAYIIQPMRYESPNDAEEDTTPDLNIQAPQASQAEPDIVDNPNSQNETGNNTNPTQPMDNGSNGQTDDINISPKTPGGPYY